MVIPKIELQSNLKTPCFAGIHHNRGFTTADTGAYNIKSLIISLIFVNFMPLFNLLGLLHN